MPSKNLFILIVEDTLSPPLTRKFQNVEIPSPSTTKNLNSTIKF